MVVEMEAASFIGSVLKGRISPNRALGTYLLLVLLLLDFLLFLYLLSLLPSQRHLTTEPPSNGFVAWLLFKGIWVDFCPSGCGWVVVHRVVGDGLLSIGL